MATCVDAGTTSRLHSTVAPSAQWSDTASQRSDETGLSTPGSADMNILRERSVASLRFVFHVNESAGSEPDLEAGHGPPTAAQSWSLAADTTLQSMLQAAEGSKGSTTEGSSGACFTIASCGTTVQDVNCFVSYEYYSVYLM